MGPTVKTSTSIALFLATAVAAHANPADDVRCHEIGFSLAAEARDAEGFRAFIDDDARFVGNAVLRGPADITEAWSVFFEEDGPSIRWRPQFVEVLEDGNLALTRGPFRVVSQGEDGNDVERWGTFNSVWRRQADDTWKVVFDAGSPASEPPADELREVLEADDDCAVAADE